MIRNHYLSYGDVDAWRERLNSSPTNGHRDPDDWQGFELYGTLPSPPCMKLATYLRWKRLPFLWCNLLGDNLKPVYVEPRFSHIKEHTVAIAVFPDGRSMNDSSFVIRAVEEKYPSRSVLPNVNQDPSLRFICQLLEDFADEWLVRCVFGFRWNDPDVRQFSGQLLALGKLGGGETSKKLSEFFIQRQLNTDNRSDAFVEGAYTDAIIYPTFLKVASAMERHFSSPHKFMCGGAPTNVDFAFYGMFYQFVQDKIPREMMIGRYPHIISWINRMNDTSGFSESDLKVTDLLLDLLKIAAESYLVFLEANAARLNDDPDNDDMITVTIFDGEEDFSAVHSQKPYAYQAKCLQWLKEDLEVALKSEQFDQVDELRKILRSTGCWHYLKTA